MQGWNHGQGLTIRRGLMPAEPSPVENQTQKPAKQGISGSLKNFL